MTPTSELRDELPPLLREWWDWTAKHANGWRYAVRVGTWLVQRFMWSVLVAITSLVLALGWFVAVSGLLMKRAWKGIKQQPAEVVPFQARRRG